MTADTLLPLACEEAATGRPPVTSVVVRKDTGAPGDGFLVAMVRVGYAPSDADERTVWERALRESHAYWRPRLGDDLDHR